MKKFEGYIFLILRAYAPEQKDITIFESYAAWFFLQGRPLLIWILLQRFLGPDDSPIDILDIQYDDDDVDPRKIADIDTEKSRTLLDNMSLNCNDLRVLVFTKSEYDDMANTDDKMTNKRMGRNVQKYLFFSTDTESRKRLHDRVLVVD